MSTTLNPEIADVQDKVEEHSKELAEMRGNLHQLSMSRRSRTTLRTRHKIIGATARLSIRRLIALIVTLLVAIAAGLAYQTSSIDKRIEQMERSSNTRLEMIEKRIDQSEKNMNARLEDLARNITAGRRSQTGSPRPA